MCLGAQPGLGLGRLRGRNRRHAGPDGDLDGGENTCAAGGLERGWAWLRGEGQGRGGEVATKDGGKTGEDSDVKEWVTAEGAGAAVWASKLLQAVVST